MKDQIGKIQKTVTVLMAVSFWYFAFPKMASASVYKIWEVKVEILEIPDRKSLDAARTPRSDSVIATRSVVLKVRYLSCKFIEGHGSLTCRANQVRDVVVELKPDQKLPEDLSVGDSLKLHYHHGISRGGQEFHQWTLAGKEKKEEVTGK